MHYSSRIQSRTIQKHLFTVFQKLVNEMILDWFVAAVRIIQGEEVRKEPKTKFNSLQNPNKKL